MKTETEVECGTLESHKIIQHDFGQAQKSAAQKATLLVALITLLTMFLEIFVGLYTGSMALFADGIHMSGHALALGLASFAYYLTYKNSNNRSYSLGSGKINELAAFNRGLFLFVTIIWLIAESIMRLLNPEAILAKEALFVAVLGLAINLISVLILAKAGNSHILEESHTGLETDANSNQLSQDSHEHSHGHSHEHSEKSGIHQHTDMNLKAALIHIFTDALTSLAAIIGLIAAWIWSIWWIDAVIALVASFWVLKWSIGLLKQTSGVLLDREASDTLRQEIIAEIEKIGGSKVVDIHIWSVGQGSWTLIAVVVSHIARQPEVYKNQLKNLNYIHHPTIEIHYCPEC